MRYIKYLAENYNSYLGTRLVYLSVLVALILVIITLEISLEQKLEDYSFEQIKIDEVFVDKYLDYSSARYDFREFVSKKALNIRSEYSDYFVDKDFSEHWSRLMTKIKSGDVIFLWYIDVECYGGTRKRVLHIVKEGETLLDIDDNKAYGRVFSYFLYFALAFFVFALSLLLYFRMSFKRNS